MIPVVKEKLKTIPPSSNLLNKKAARVRAAEIHSAEVRAVIGRMLEMAESQQGDTKKRTLVGLAAPQVGVSKRIILVDVTTTGKADPGEIRVYINPKIVKRSRKKEDGREGCFSTGDVCGVVKRSSEVTIEALDQEGNKIRESHTGFTARIFQHEIDHLDGIRFPDRVSDETKLHWVTKDKFGEYRENWQNWSDLCSREQWEAIKTGRTAKS